MSGQSLKSRWQTDLVRSELGAGPVGVGMVMSTYANVDGTGVHPSMETVAKGMGCSRGYVERHCAALVEHDRLTTVAKAIPGHRGTEYRLTFAVGQVLQSEALEVSAKCSNQDGQVLQSVPQVLQSEPASAPNTSITMRSTMSLNHERHHDPTAEPTGDAAWAWVEAEAAAKAAALAEVLLDAPPFE
jgi:hypothetical protein